ncbi:MULTISPECIES: DMT family transporter [unclassified Luteococcus]|uniref:DMT family transporter n=1 Tax=unclassified Luteococcus TaxID=2639923 RepID=UPI00313B44BE
MKGWAWVLLGGVFEVGFTTFLQLQQSDPTMGLGFLVCAVLSFECLARGIRTLPLGLAYAVWTGIGSVGAFVIGIAAFEDPSSPLRIAVVTALVAALVALKLVSGRDQSATAPTPAPHPVER